MGEVLLQKIRVLRIDLQLPRKEKPAMLILWKKIVIDVGKRIRREKKTFPAKRDIFD
jgi:hypothetical protein